MTPTSTSQNPFIDTLIQSLRGAEAPLTRARITAHPACREWTERILTNVLCAAVDRGLVRRAARSTFELTDTGRGQLC